MKTFIELGISKDFVKGLTELSIITPSEIQAQVIHALLNKTTDLVGQAQTGTGKTAAYGLPLLERIDPKQPKIQGLILCPTRELGQQVAKQRLEQVKAALHRIEAGEFGLCLDCEDEIELPRLTARPEAPFCLDCQAAREKRG